MTGLKFEKNQIREEVLNKRLNIPSDLRENADRRMCDRLFSLASFRFAETVLLYFPIKCEPDVLEHDIRRHLFRDIRLCRVLASLA